MKNMVKLLGFIALVAVFGFSFTACDNNPDHTHEYSTTWSTDATQHWRECSCGDKTALAAHNWQWVVTTPATATAEGLETETCSTCEATNDTRLILLCKCKETYGTLSHLGIDETCTCSGTDCSSCTEQIATLEEPNINIRKEAGILVADMNTIVDNIITGYEQLPNDVSKNKLVNNNIEIWIVKNKPPLTTATKEYGIDYEGDSNKYILKIGDNYSIQDVKGFFLDCIDDIPLL